MEHKALERGGDNAASAKAKKPLTGKKRISKKATAAKSISQSVGLKWGPVTVSARAFAELESCLTKPARPTQSIQNAARMMRTLYKVR